LRLRGGAVVALLLAGGAWPRAAPAAPNPAAATVQAQPSAPRGTVALEVALDPAARRATGHARLSVTNTSAAALTDVALWLYPNHLAVRPAGLSDVSFHWLYPGLFSPAAMQVAGARVGGAPAPLALEDTPAGSRTLARVALPAPLPPGATTTVDIDFDTRLPRRFGAFGCDGPRCRLMGGFYPMAAHLGAHGWELGAAPDRVDARVTASVPPELALVLDGDPIDRQGRAAATVESRDVPYASVVTDRALRVAAAEAGGVRLVVLHRAPRPPDSEDRPLPYVREDVPGLVLDTARDALGFLRDQGLSASGGPRRLTLVEAPLRHELCQVHGDVILVSHQIFGIFPLGRLRKYHRFALARAVFTAAVAGALAPFERAEDRDLAAGVLASYLTDVYTMRASKKIEYARDLLRPFDFIPAVDQLIYAPLVASPDAYFGDADDADPVRDDVRRFSTAAPSPRLVYGKLLDLLGAPGMARLARQVLGEGVPLRRAAAEVFGGELGWFWRQWLGPRPRLNYRLDGVRVAARPGQPGATHVTVDVAREGDDVREPVEVRVQDRAGGVQTLIWAEAGPRHRFEVDLPAGLDSVEVDPRERLQETALGSLRPSDDPRTDNRRPPRWRLLYEGFGGLLNISALTANFAAVFVLKPQHDLRHEIVLRAFHTEALQLGAGATYAWNFGPQADKNSLTSSLFGGFTVSRLDPRFGVAPDQPARPGWRVTGRAGFDHDTRDYLVDPWRAVGVEAIASYSLTALDDGSRLSQVGGTAEALRLFELLPGHVLALDTVAAATAGDLRHPSQLPSAGGPTGLRGFFADELLARALVIGRVQLRDDYVSELDWNLLHFTTVRGLAGTLFADVAATTSCERYDFSRHNVQADVGYSFRVLHDAFGIYQQLLSIDLAVPLNRHAGPQSCLGVAGDAAARPPFVVLVTFLPSF
jgi:hypothetical protein